MNQNPEQLARDRIDAQLLLCGWTIQDKKTANLSAAIGIAIHEYSTDVGPADYGLFVNKKPVGITEAKREVEGVRPTMAEERKKFDFFEEQRQIGQEKENCLNVCNKIEETITTSLKKAKALWQSILKKVFEGNF